MSIRQTSQKFQRSLPSFSRKADHDDAADGGGTQGGAGGGIKKLSNRLAHTTLLPALGNSETRLLQDLITAEKGVMNAHERLSSETDRAAATLSIWAASEGPDLSDVFSSSSILLRHLSSALQRFGEHEASIRSNYKTIRTKDEEFDELKKRRRAVGKNAEAAERKLQKMGPENKNLPSQTELLERLRDEMRQLDSEILTGEARLGDLKRRLSKQAMAIKFGGLLELAEKMTIVGELGKLLIDEIPLEETPPGFGRAPYGGFEQCSRLVDEASRCISEVKFTAPEIQSVPSTLPAAGPAAHTDQFGDYPAYGSLYGERRGPIARADSGALSHNGQVVFDAPGSPRVDDAEHDYEWEQQREMDAAREREEAVWREDAEAAAVKAGVIPPVAEVGLPVPSGDEPSSRRYADESPSRLYADRSAARYSTPPESPVPTTATPTHAESAYAYDASELSYARDPRDLQPAAATPPLAFTKASTPGKIPAGAFRRRDDEMGASGRRLAVPRSSDGAVNATGTIEHRDDDGAFPDAVEHADAALPAYERER